LRRNVNSLGGSNPCRPIWRRLPIILHQKWNQITMRATWLLFFGVDMFMQLLNPACMPLCEYFMLVYFLHNDTPFPKSLNDFAIVASFGFYHVLNCYVFCIHTQKNNRSTNARELLLYQTGYCNSDAFPELKYTAKCWLILTRHRTSTSTRWHFAFGLRYYSNETHCTDCKSAQ